jgi:lactate dehydrogenase-like 2-hydroxyacid dehydrogenase
MAALGPQGTLVNVARGTVVDEVALIEALSTSKLGWAGLDVFEQEPKVPQALRDLPNTVLLPHVGSGTVETRKAMGDLVVDNLIDHLTKGSVRTPVPECKALA